MGDEELPNLINSIKRSTSKSKLYHCLKILRRIVDDKSKFTLVRESGGLRLILTYLPKNSLEIVDIILSIIGNCCMDRECSKEVVKYNGLSIFCDILKRATEDSVICRVLRILGNIAQFDNFASEIYKYSVVPQIVKLLNSSNEKTEGSAKKKNDNIKQLSMDTEGMAVRALRILWQSYSNRQNMINDDVIRAVSMVLIRNTQKWLKKDEVEHIRRRREKLLENVLKCLLLYSKWGTLICAEQMLANGHGFKSLVSLVDLYPYSAIKCLTNLSPVAKSRTEIDISAAVQSIVDKIKFHVKKKTGRGCPSEIVNAFCLFSRHPLNCCEVKRAGGLPLILEVLKNCRSRKQEFQIIHALPGFLYDEASQEILVSNGIVRIVIDCLERNLKTKTPLDEPHTYIKSKKTRDKRKERSSSTPILKLNSQRCSEPRPTSPVLDDFFNKMSMLSGRSILTQCLTPSDSESSVLSSPGASPPRRIEEDNDDDSVNYSPVCSETEEMDIEESSSSLTPHLSPQVFEDSDKDCENEQEHFDASDMQEKSVIVMLIVLSRTLHIKPYPTDLRELRTIETLLKYLRESKYPQGRVTNLLTHIFGNVENLLALISNGSIYMIHSLTQVQHNNSCSKCIRMKDVGEDLIEKLSDITVLDKAKTILCEQMTCDNKETKANCIMVVPYVVKVKSLLKYVMDTCGGLNFLLSHYQSSITDRMKTLTALNKLACRININNPCLENTANKILKIPANFDVNASATNSLTIRLDDGQTVITDRDFLIAKVEYFKAMLSGSFKEAEQESIKLRNVSYDALNFLLYLLTSNNRINEPILLEVDLDTVLEVIILTDSYLLESLTEWLTSCVESYMINVNSASQIYKWSVESGTNFLRVETVAYLLTGKMFDKERYRLCENILDGGFVDQLCNDFQDLIIRYLKMR